MAEESKGWERKTFHWELARSVPAGVVETVTTTFAVYLAVVVFRAGALEKAVLVAAGSAGMLLSLFFVQFIRKLGCSLNLSAAFVWLLSASGFFLAILGQKTPWFYFFGMTLGQVAVVVAVPLFSHIYREHYPTKKRGRLFASAGIVRKVAAILAGLSFGFILENDLQNYPWLLAAYGVCCLLMVGCVVGFKKVYLSRVDEVKLFDAFRHVREDRIFRRLLIAWMILGTGNLISVALFVEYAANPTYGFNLGAAEVSWLTTITPEAAYLVTVFLWGVLFDRINFFWVRTIINVFFIGGILMFFLGSEVWMLYVGLALHGVGKAGGNVAWNLWVTKFARSEHVAEYMSVHTFLTGCRGTLAPIFAFLAVAAYSPQLVGIVGAVLMSIATWMIFSLKNHAVGESVK